MRRYSLVLAAASIFSAALGGYFVLAPEPDSVAEEPPATTSITKADLLRQTTWDGVLVYSKHRDLIHRVDPTATTVSSGGQRGGPTPVSTITSAEGVLTWLAPLGSRVSNGEELYRVGDRPVVLLEGEVVLWRTLEVGSVGNDVLAIEQLLVDMGYDPNGLVVVDDSYSGTTDDMVARFQDAVGQEVSGDLSLGTVVISRDPLRVADHLAEVGQTLSDGVSVISVTSWARQVDAVIPPITRDRIEPGLELQVRLPDRSLVGATVVRISPSIDPDSASYNAVLSVSDVVDLRNDQLDVTVIDTAILASKVLLVEPNALIALEGGEYALRVPAPGGVTFDAVAVEVLGVSGRLAAIAGEVVEGTVVLSN